MSARRLDSERSWCGSPRDILLGPAELGINLKLGRYTGKTAAGLKPIGSGLSAPCLGSTHTRNLANA